MQHSRTLAQASDHALDGPPLGGQRALIGAGLRVSARRRGRRLVRSRLKRYWGRNLQPEADPHRPISTAASSATSRSRCRSVKSLPRPLTRQLCLPKIQRSFLSVASLLARPMLGRGLTDVNVGEARRDPTRHPRSCDIPEGWPRAEKRHGSLDLTRIREDDRQRSCR